MIAFPVDVSTFVAYQEQLVGRKLSEGERETTAAWWTASISLMKTD